MALGQVLNSVHRIIANPHLRTLPALGRYALWQGRRLLGRFPVELPLSKSVLTARSGRCGVSALVNAHGMYDFNNFSLIKMLLSEGGGFVDVGANVGAFTLVAAEQPAARVLALEPHPGTYCYVAANVERNGYRNVQLLQAAAGAQEGSVTITDTPGSSTTHIVRNAPGLNVPLRRLDALLAEHDFQPDVVKIDVEGFELDVLRGLGERLKDVRVLFVEINGLSNCRDAGSEALVEFLHDAKLAGPYYYDHRTRMLRLSPVLTGEDPLFVNEVSLRTLGQQHGIRREGCHD
jgi:FkbM family methyltransferase